MIHVVVRPQEPKKLISLLHKKPLVLYGFGGLGASIARWCDENGIAYILADRDAEKKQSTTDKQIITPAQLAENFPDANIVISSILYHNEILEKLMALGIRRENIIPYQMFLPKQITWRELEHATVWGMHTGRIEMIAGWIPAGVRSVADYGAGKLGLRRLLDPSIAYYPIDYVKRSEDTIICDFDQDMLPELKTDVSVCTATLVFIAGAKELLEHICMRTSDRIILSYVLLETFRDVEGRRASGYISDLTDRDIRTMLGRHGFELREVQPAPANRIDTIYLFCKK